MDPVLFVCLVLVLMGFALLMLAVASFFALAMIGAWILRLTDKEIR